MKPTKVIPVKDRRKFDEIFEREAVNIWLDRNKTAEVIAEELSFDFAISFVKLLHPPEFTAAARRT